MKHTSDPLKVISHKIVPVHFDFGMDVSHSLASRSSTVNICVVLESESGLKGYGECVPRSYVTGETPDSVMTYFEELEHEIAARSYSRPRDVVDELETAWTAHGRENPAAFCALDIALLDLAGKHFGRGIQEMLGLAQSDEPLYYSLIVPLLPEAALDRFLDWTSQFEFRHVKIKVDEQDPAGRVRHVMNRLGNDIEVRLDANCSWRNADAAAFMKDMARLGVVSVEQPLLPNDLEGTARLRGPGMPLITLDESVCNMEDVNRAADAGACDIINVRISKCGGILHTLHIIRTALDRGLGVQLGAHVGESCILSAAGARLASGTGGFRWLEGCFGTHLLRTDLCEGSFKLGHGGRMNPPRGPGLGVDILDSRLEELRTSWDRNGDTGAS